MPTFYNQATLTYNNTVITSNVTAGELIEVLEGLVILFVSTPGIFRAARKIIRARNERRPGNGVSA